jgi:LemA protein
MVSTTVWIIIAVVAVVAIFIYYYNKFVSLENRIQNSEAQIDVQLKKRADLVPSLVKVVKGFAKHEEAIFDKITKAREALMGAKSLAAEVKAGDQLQGFLGKLFAIAESNPEIKSNTNYLQLQQELAAIEDKVAYSRQFYNDSIQDFQNASEKFPGVFFFKLYSRKQMNFLKIPEADKKMPDIDL